MSSTSTNRIAIKRPAANGHRKLAIHANASQPAPVHESLPFVSTTGRDFQIVVARTGDHILARNLLTNVQHTPSQAEFQSQLDDPYYEPNDRLFCVTNGTMFGHVHVMKREMRLGAATLPVAMLHDLLVLPELRGQGCGTRLLAEAERRCAADGAAFAIVRTAQPSYFLKRGWCAWVRHSYSVAGVREILSQLLAENRPDAEDEAAHDSATAISIRCWRHIEEPGLRRLYELFSRATPGTLVRSEAYWQWLLSRHAFDRIYVAIAGPDRFDLSEGADALVGYAVMKEGRILELVTLPGHPSAPTKLLSRACADTIEIDRNYVQLDAPVGDPLHLVLARAGGELSYHEAVRGEACLVKMLDLERAVELLGDELHVRAAQAGLETPLELGFEVEDQPYTLELRPRSTRIRPERIGRSFLRCSRAELTQMLLGHLDVQVAVDAKRIQASTRVALDYATKLFPKRRLWRPPWDELPAE